MNTITTIRVGNGPELPIDLDNPSPAVVSELRNAIDKIAGRAPRLKDTAEERAMIDGLVNNEVKAFVERIEAQEERIKDERSDLKEIFAEAKGRGFDTKILRKVVARRKRKKDDIAEEEAIMDLYLAALDS